MASNMIRQTMFTTGEVDAINFKRTDFPDYLTCAQNLLNCEVGTTGLAKKRRGTKFNLDLTPYADQNSQLYEFQDKNGNYYIGLSAHLKFYILTINSSNVITGRGNQVVTLRGNDVIAYANYSVYQVITTPYLSADLLDLDTTQDNDALIITHPNYPPARIYISDYSALVFSYQALNIYPLPSYDFGNINYNNFTVAATSSATSITLQFTGLASDPGFTTAWIGGQIIGLGASVNDPIGYAIITAVTPWTSGVHTVTFTGSVQIPFSNTLPTVGSQYSIRQPAWNNSNPSFGFPGKVLFYQNRLWLANTPLLNNTMFGSRINAPINFDVGVARDTDAIVYTIGQGDSGGILWMNGGKQLEIYTQNYEFAAPQEQNLGLTPSTFSIRQQSAYGSSSNIKPVTYINDSYYVTKTGKAIINFHFNGIGQTYTSSNVSVASTHLVKNPSNSALQRGTDISQDNFVYYLNFDNTITAFQFATEYKLAALTPIDFNTNPVNPVRVKDIATINNTVYFLKFYSLTNTYTLESFDDTERIDGYIISSMASNGLINGLDIYNGYTVQVVFNNQDFGQYTIVNGSITVNNPNEYSGVVEVGLLYQLKITPMYLYAGPQAADYFKNINRIYVDYYNSLNFYVNGKLVKYQNFADIQAGLPLQPQTGTAIIESVNGWSRNSTFDITQNSPFDLQVTAIGYQISAAII